MFVSDRKFSTSCFMSTGPTWRETMDRHAVNRWPSLREIRIYRAQELLETTDLPVEVVAHSVGFTAASTFRERFRAIVGTNPSSYRHLYRGGPR